MTFAQRHRVDLTVLGIESSCDDTAAAVVRARLIDGRIAPPGDVLSNMVRGQTREHAPYGGVVPEIAARAHVERLDALIARALEAAGTPLAEVDLIAATAGPGLIGGVIAGLMTAKGLALGAGKPLVAVNHLEGHALSPRLTGDAPFPYLLLLVSGGHCQLLAVAGPGRCRRLGGTIDDAAGEAFDKVAKRMGLGFPGGPAVEARARRGDPDRFDLPRPMVGRPGCDFSFSGLKTAAARLIDELGPTLSGRDADDLCASFQAAVAACLTDRARRATALFREIHPTAARPPLVVAGGVAANGAIRAALDDLAQAEGFVFAAPPLWLCTDNGAMIAWAGAERFADARAAAGGDDAAALRGLTEAAMGLRPRARWPLDEDAPPQLGGSGAKGPKA